MDPQCLSGIHRFDSVTLGLSGSGHKPHNFGQWPSFIWKSKFSSQVLERIYTLFQVQIVV